LSIVANLLTDTIDLDRDRSSEEEIDPTQLPLEPPPNEKTAENRSLEENKITNAEDTLFSLVEAI